MSASKYLGEVEINHNMTKEELAIDFLSKFSHIDGSHHKAWLLDQLARILMGTPVNATKASWVSGHSELRLSTGEPSKEYLDWIGNSIHDEDVIGIAP